MKARVAASATKKCRRCGGLMKANGRRWKCKKCGSIEWEEEDKWEKAFMKQDYTRHL